MKHHSTKGFALIELMVVLAIVAILVVIVSTTYRSYQIRAHRADVKTQMSIIAQNLATYRLANNDYGASSSYAANVLQNSAIYGGTSFPLIGTQYYDFTITASPSSSWTLRAVPRAGSQANNGDIKLTDQGWRCWSQGNANCTLSASSTWD